MPQDCRRSYHEDGKPKEGGHPSTSSRKEEASKVRVVCMNVRSSQDEDEELSRRQKRYKCNQTFKESTRELERLGVCAS